jgi:hypothetical protein
MTAEGFIPIALALQGALGAVDTLVNHELIEGLRRRPEARGEVGLHALREAIYASLFGGLAWFAWHGAAAAVVGALLVAEVVVTALDESVENRIRVLPQNERVLHVFLTLNLGVLLALLVPVLSEWSRQPGALVPLQHGALSWLLTAFAVASAIWSVLDFLAWRRR